MAQAAGVLGSAWRRAGGMRGGSTHTMAGLPAMRLAALARPSSTAPSPLAALVDETTLRFCRTAAPCSGGGSWGGRQGLWGRGVGVQKCFWRADLNIGFHFILKAYSDSSHRQLSNGTGLSSRLHRTRELWANHVWGYCRVLPAPPPPGAFLPFPPVLPHACRTAVLHVRGGDQGLTVLISIGLHGLWQGLGVRGLAGVGRVAADGGSTSAAVLMAAWATCTSTLSMALAFLCTGGGMRLQQWHTHA